MNRIYNLRRVHKSADLHPYEQACLDKIVHGLREMRVLYYSERAKTLAYSIMLSEVNTWREALDLFRKISKRKNK